MGVDQGHGASKWQSEPRLWVPRFLTLLKVCLTGYTRVGMTHPRGLAALAESIRNAQDPPTESGDDNSPRPRKGAESGHPPSSLKRTTEAPFPFIPRCDPNFRLDSKGGDFS